MKLVQAQDPYDWAALLRLITTSFAYMDGRIDPPSSMLTLTVEDIARQARSGEIWVIENPRPVACVFLTPRPHALYVGKLTTVASHRRQGYARRLLDQAEKRARALGLPALELQSRIELVENHTAFASLGFQISGETTHPGFDHPTALIFTKPLN